jgi:hypothetical protein
MAGLPRRRQKKVPGSPIQGLQPAASTNDADADSDSETVAESDAPPTASRDAATASDAYALAKRIEELSRAVAQVRAETLQTGDFVRKMERTLSDGTDAIRGQAMADANESLIRSHSSLVLARIDATLRGEDELSASLRRIEADMDAELAALDIVPLIPAHGDPIDTRAMRTQGTIPDGIDPATATKTVGRIITCGYRLPHRTILPTVTVEWGTAGMNPT